MDDLLTVSNKATKHFECGLFVGLTVFRNG